MFNCDWAQSLTRYDCQPLTALDGGPCLEIGTPFSLPDGSAINLYLTQVGDNMIKIGDNADSLFQLGGMGLDVWHPAKQAALRALLRRHNLSLDTKGDVYLLAQNQHAANGFAVAVTGLLALSGWAGDQLQTPASSIDMVAELEPYIIARNPAATYKRHPHAMGASRTEYEFDLQHGADLIDVIGPSPQATGAAMRKAGDIQNGPFAEHLSPLFVVYDLKDSARAESEISILGSMARAIPASRLMRSLH
jgi:hypothetical protein